MLLNERQAGFCGGTLSGLIPLVSTGELVHTLILAGTGATVSFFISYFLKRMLRQAQHDEARERGGHEGAR